MKIKIDSTKKECIHLVSDYVKYGSKNPGPKMLPSIQNQEWKKNQPKETKTIHNKSNRFLTLYDMAEAKRLDAILNSRINRFEVEKKAMRHMFPCSCGNSGCIIVYQA